MNKYKVYLCKILFIMLFVSVKGFDLLFVKIIFKGLGEMINSLLVVIVFMVIEIIKIFLFFKGFIVVERVFLLFVKFLLVIIIKVLIVFR